MWFDTTHNAVESSERKNVYDGVAELGADGTAWVELDEWSYGVSVRCFTR
jgi:hypothetical protein